MICMHMNRKCWNVAPICRSAFARSVLLLSSAFHWEQKKHSWFLSLYTHIRFPKRSAICLIYCPVVWGCEALRRNTMKNWPEPSHLYTLETLLHFLEDVSCRNQLFQRSGSWESLVEEWYVHDARTDTAGQINCQVQPGLRENDGRITAVCV